MIFFCNSRKVNVTISRGRRILSVTSQRYNLKKLDLFTNVHRTLSLVQTIYKVKTRHCRDCTNEVDDESAVRETASGMVEEGFSIWRKRDVRKIVRIREAEQVSGVGNRIAETDDRLETPALWFRVGCSKKKSR